MFPKDFISDALCQPCTFTSYYVSRRLVELYPSRHVIEGTDYEFEVEKYAAAGECTVVREATLHSQTRTRFDEARKPLEHTISNGWLNILWRGRLLDVVFLTLGDNRLHWIVANDQATAEGFFRHVCEWSSEVRGEILVFEGGYWQKDADIYRAIREASFDDLILPATLKGELRTDLRRFFTARETYERYRIPWKRGVLLIGPPGNGKTGAIKALINDAAKPCLYVKSLKSRYDTEHGGVRSVFERARAAAPCLLVLEDLDSLLTNANRSLFLNELDGFAANEGVVVLASTNHPERLDSSILDRPSRFDRKFYFELPAHTERLAYFTQWDARMEPEMRLTAKGSEEAAAATEGFSFAYLKEAVLSAMMNWMVEARAGTMDAIMRERIAVLRSQMSEKTETKPTPKIDEDSAGNEDDE